MISPYNGNLVKILPRQKHKKNIKTNKTHIINSDSSCQPFQGFFFISG